MERIETFKDKEMLRGELGVIVERIRASHERGETQRDGVGFSELYALVPIEWQEYLGHADEMLGLSTDESAELELLIKKLLEERLTADDKERMVEYVARFENAKQEKMH